MAKEQKWKPAPEPIDLAPDDPRNRFLFLAENCEFLDAPPITEEEKEEAAHIWASIAKKSSPGFRVKSAKK